MAVYTWNVRKWLYQYLDRDSRKPAFVALLYSFLRPIEVLHEDFLARKTEVDRRLKFNSQQKSFAHVLNDLFDDTLRRITVVTDDDLVPRTYIHKRSEPITLPEKVFIYRRSEVTSSPIYIFHRSENESYAHFTVNVPAEIIANDEKRLRAEIDYYRYAGRTYRLNAI